MGRFANTKWAFAVLLAALCAVLAASASPARAQAQPKRVLLLYPYDNALPASNIAGEAARKRLLEQSKLQISFYVDFLDLVRFPDDTHGERTARYLAEKYAQTRLDLIVVLNTESQRFAVRHRQLFAPGVPIVFCCVTRALMDGAPRPPDVTGIINEYDITKTVELAQRLQPNARNLVYIGGASEVDRRWTETYAKQLAPFEDKLKITYLVGLPHEALLQRVSQLPRDTIVLIGTIFADGTGRQFVPVEAGDDIARVSAAPTYGPADPFLGRGIVGGHMGTFESSGTEVADLALEILSGADPRTIEPRSSHALKYRVDARQLERWGLSEKNLPEDTVLYFKMPTLWQEHRDVVITTAAIIAVQAVLISALLFQFFRRRRAEFSRKHAEQAMQVAQSELARVARQTTMGEMTASIAHEVNQPLAAIVASSNAGLRWLNGPTPNFEQAKAAFTRIVTQGHRAAEVITTIRAMFKNDTSARAHIDLNRLVNEVLALVQGEMQDRDVVVKAVLARDLPLLQADRVQLQQVILNLVINAAEAMSGIADRERTLRIRSEKRLPADVLLTIEDSGPGIAPENMDRIFEAFYTTKAHGMGMGLSICRSIVESHGGRLSASHRYPHGAVFQLVLPIEQRD